jgi:acetyl esterase/lipase
MNIQKTFIPLLIILFFVSSCKKEDDTVSITASTKLNVSYGSDSAQKMDVYLPPNRTIVNTKVMIMIHGGGWTSGDKADLTGFVDTLKKRFPSYAIFNVNYRLSANPNNLFPTQEMDIKAAIEYIYSKKNEYMISNKYVLLGASAGAHLAMLQGYKYNIPVKAKAVVSFFGPSDLTDMYNDLVNGDPVYLAVLVDAVGTTPSIDPVLYYNSSPINFINSSAAIPTILIHGGQDPLVSPTQSLAVQTKLFTMGIANQFVFYPLGGHGNWSAVTYTDSFNKIQAFLQANVE